MRQLISKLAANHNHKHKHTTLTQQAQNEFLNRTNVTLKFEFELEITVQTVSLTGANLQTQRERGKFSSILQSVCCATHKPTNSCHTVVDGAASFALAVSTQLYVLMRALFALYAPIQFNSIWVQFIQMNCKFLQTSGYTLPAHFLTLLLFLSLFTFYNFVSLRVFFI